MNKLLCAILLCVAFGLSAIAEDFHRREATVTKINAENKVVTFLVAPKTQTSTAKPVAYDLFINGRYMDREIVRVLPSRRKVRASFSDLQVGQRVILSGSSGVSGGPVTELIIFSADSK